MKALRWLLILMIGFCSIRCTDDAITPKGDNDTAPPATGGGGGGSM